ARPRAAASPRPRRASRAWGQRKGGPPPARPCWSGGWCGLAERLLVTHVARPGVAALRLCGGVIAGAGLPHGRQRAAARAGLCEHERAVLAHELRLQLRLVDRDTEGAHGADRAPDD